MPDTLDGAAFNLWCETTGRWPSAATRRRWIKMTPADRKVWRGKAQARLAAYGTMTDGGRRIANAKSRRATVEINETELRKMTAEKSGSRE